MELETEAPAKHQKFRLDLSLNVGNIIAIVTLILTISSYGKKAVDYLHDIHNKVSIMWIQFAKDYPEAAQQYDKLKTDN